MWSNIPMGMGIYMYTPYRREGHLCLKRTFSLQKKNLKIKIDKKKGKYIKNLQGTKEEQHK